MTKDQILASANSKLSELKSATSTDKVDSLSSEIEDLLKQANGLCLSETYESVFESDNPFKNAVTATSKKYSLVAKKDKDLKKTLYEISEKNIRINLVDVAKKRDIGVDKYWCYFLEKLNVLMTLRVASEIGNEAIFNLLRKNPSYFMSEKANEIKMHEKEQTINGKKVANPISNSSLITNLQTLVNMTIGEGTVYKKDLNFVIEAYSKQSKSNLKALQTPNTRNFATIIQGMLEEVMSRTNYAIESKVIEKGEKAIAKASSAK